MLAIVGPSCWSSAWNVKLPLPYCCCCCMPPTPLSPTRPICMCCLLHVLISGLAVERRRVASRRKRWHCLGVDSDRPKLRTTWSTTSQNWCLCFAVCWVLCACVLCTTGPKYNLSNSSFLSALFIAERKLELQRYNQHLYQILLYKLLLNFGTTCYLCSLQP